MSQPDVLRPEAYDLADYLVGPFDYAAEPDAGQPAAAPYEGIQEWQVPFYDVALGALRRVAGQEELQPDWMPGSAEGAQLYRKLAHPSAKPTAVAQGDTSAPPERMATPKPAARWRSPKVRDISDTRKVNPFDEAEVIDIPGTDRYLTISEAADMLGITDEDLEDLIIDKGTRLAVHDDGSGEVQHYIPAASCSRLMAYLHKNPL